MMQRLDIGIQIPGYFVFHRHMKNECLYQDESVDRGEANDKQSLLFSEKPEKMGFGDKALVRAVIIHREKSNLGI